MKLSALVAGSCLGRSGTVICQMLPIGTSMLTGAHHATNTPGVHDGLACCSTHTVACMVLPKLGMGALLAASQGRWLTHARSM